MRFLRETGFFALSAGCNEVFWEKPGFWVPCVIALATATPSPEVAEALLALLDAGKVASLEPLISPAGENK
jgi:hypothetical protein